MTDIVAALREDAAALGRQQANAGFGAELHIRVAKPGLLRKTLTNAAAEIEHLRNLLSMAEHCRDSAERDARECRERLRPFAKARRIYGDKASHVPLAVEHFVRAAEMVEEEATSSPPSSPSADAGR